MNVIEGLRGLGHKSEREMQSERFEVIEQIVLNVLRYRPALNDRQLFSEMATRAILESWDQDDVRKTTADLEERGFLKVKDENSLDERVRTLSPKGKMALRGIRKMKGGFSQAVVVQLPIGRIK